MSSINLAQQLANLQFTMTGSLIKAFLEYVTENYEGCNKVSSIIKNFDEMFEDFLKDTDLNIDLNKLIDVKVNTSGPKTKKERKSKFSFEHVSDKCSHKFTKGVNADKYCNSKLSEDDNADGEHCKVHQNKNEKEQVPCSAKNKDGKSCKKHATATFKGKKYCSVHLTQVKSPKKSKTVVEDSDDEMEVKSKKSKKQADVETDDEMEVETKKSKKRNIVNIDISDDEE